MIYCLYCNKQIIDPWPNQTRHKPCNRKHKAETMREYRAKLKEQNNERTINQA